MLVASKQEFGSKFQKDRSKGTKLFRVRAGSPELSVQPLPQGLWEEKLFIYITTYNFIKNLPNYFTVTYVIFKLLKSLTTG